MNVQREFELDLEKIVAYIQEGYRAELHCDFSRDSYELNLWTNESHKKFHIRKEVSLDTLKSTIKQAMKKKFALNLKS